MMRQRKYSVLSHQQMVSLMLKTHAHRMLLHIILLGAALFYAEAAFAESPNDILVVTSLSVKTKSVTVEELRDFFLKVRSSWPSGERVIPIHTGDDPHLRNQFREMVLKMSSSEERRYWQTKQVKDGDSDPPIFANVLKVVFKLRGAISYVYRSQYKEGVAKVLLVLPATRGDGAK
jgi:hypothetical protein